MTRTSHLRLSVVTLWAVLLCPDLGSSVAVKSGQTPAEDGMMYDFRTMESVDDWVESSDTVRVPGKSKASFELQKTKLFQRAVFFGLLNPQPNGAAFAGIRNDDNWDLSQYQGLEMQVRRQGESSFYKMVLRSRAWDPAHIISYEYPFEVPADEFVNVVALFSEFKPYYQGSPAPDAYPLDLTDITYIAIQVFGGVFSDFFQSGPGTLEIDYMKAV